jgi:hypothetical protein
MTAYEYRVGMDDVYECQGCGGRLQPSDEVRALYRELSDDARGEPPMRRWAYTHLGHEPSTMEYRIIGRGKLADLERERRNEDG